MNWLKKLIGASILSSLLIIAPERAQAEMCVSCGLYNTGGYNLYSFGQSMNSLASCAMPVNVTAIPVSPALVVPSYLSNPTGFLNSFATPSYASFPSSSFGGGCGTFTQSCGSSYDTLGFAGCGTLPMVPSIDSQLLNLINTQNILLTQLSNPFSTSPFGTSPYSGGFPGYGGYSTPPGGFFPPSMPFPSSPITSYDNSIPFPTTPSLPYGGCDNITVMCPQPGVNSFENTFPGGSPGATPGFPQFSPELGVGSLPPDQNLIPRGFKAHR